MAGLPSDLARIAAALERIAAAVEDLGAKQRPAPKVLKPVDEERLAALLPAVFGRLGGQPWKVGDLTKGLQRFDPSDRKLRLALDAIPGSLGKFLPRCNNREAAGLRLEHAGDAGHQNVWRIRPVGSKSP